MTEDIESGYLSWKECFSLPILLSRYQLIILAMIEIHESPLENKNSQKKKTQTESFYVKRNVSWSSCVPVPGLAFCVPKQWVITDKSSRGQVEFYFRPQKSRHFSKRKKKCSQTKWASAGLFVSGTGRFYVNKIWIATTGNLAYKRNIRHMEKTHCCGVNTRESPTARLVRHS